MTTDAKLEKCPPIAYAGIRSQVSIGGLGEAIPRCLDETLKWLSEKGVAPEGAPLVRYHTCPTVPCADALLDVCIGWPVPATLRAEGRFVRDSLPEGTYAALVYTGVENGIAGNAALIAWARDNHVEWDSWTVEGGEGFAGRVEHMLDGPEEDPNPSKWRTKVAIKVKIGRSGNFLPATLGRDSAYQEQASQAEQDENRGFRYRSHGLECHAGDGCPS